MSAEQLVRTAHGGIGDSDFVRVFGKWNGQFIITAHECVLYTVDATGGRVPVPWSQMHKLMHATCVNPGTGIEIGAIADFDNPLHTPSPLSPIVWLTDLGAFPVDLWDSQDAIPSAQIIPGMQVSILGLNVSGEVRDPVAARQYLTTKDVRAAVLRFPQNLSGCEGAPVAAVGGPNDGMLVGMVFNLSTGGGQTLAYCYPAAEFTAIG